MGIKTYNPYTPSRRNMTGSDFDEITKSTPEKSLCVSLKKNAGRNNQGKIIGILSINYDITILLAAQSHIQSFTATAADDTEASGPETVSMNVSDLLDELIEQAFQRIGKPAAVMTKDDKIDFIRLLNDAGAFLITKSGDKVAKYFGISK